MKQEQKLRKLIRKSIREVISEEEVDKDATGAADQGELSPAQVRYRKFFKDVLDKFGEKSPSDMSDEEKKKFFNYIKNNWDDESHERTDESVNELTAKQEKNLPDHLKKAIKAKEAKEGKKDKQEEAIRRVIRKEIQELLSK